MTKCDPQSWSCEQSGPEACKFSLKCLTEVFLNFLPIQKLNILSYSSLVRLITLLGSSGWKEAIAIQCSYPWSQAANMDSPEASSHLSPKLSYLPRQNYTAPHDHWDVGIWLGCMFISWDPSQLRIARSQKPVATCRKKLSSLPICYFDAFPNHCHRQFWPFGYIQFGLCSCNRITDCFAQDGWWNISCSRIFLKYVA